MSEAQRSGRPDGPVVLVILDGWGIGLDEPGNAILRAKTPVMDRLWQRYPHATLQTCGESVGLPHGQMGNSEVGHMNLGAGFIVYQTISRIDRAIDDGSFATNKVLTGAMTRAREDGGTLHLLGLVSDGGVHSHLRHLEALLRLAAAQHVRRVAIHVITDGRDTSPTAGLGYVRQIEQLTASLGAGQIATVSGRYYAMDRDHRWRRTQQAYDAIVRGAGPQAASAASAIQTSYDHDVTDEFIMPTVIAPGGHPVAPIQPGDSVIFFNFRADRARQLTAALSVPDFSGFDRGVPPQDLHMVTMTQYEDGLPVRVAFAPHDVVHPVARVISEAGLRQYHTAETEKYAHVTFFFNGGREEPFPGEKRLLVPSPKVPTYDLQPEMSAPGVTDSVLRAIAERYPFIIVNFANGDMVGHTGVLDAATKAVETVDACLGQVLEALLPAGGVAIVTADHGNAEEMIVRETGQPMTAHTTNPVAVILVAPDDHPLRHADLRQGAVLSAVAPTVLALLGLTPPDEMTQASLVLPADAQAQPLDPAVISHCLRREE